MLSQDSGNLTVPPWKRSPSVVTNRKWMPAAARMPAAVCSPPPEIWHHLFHPSGVQDDVILRGPTGPGQQTLPHLR